MNHFGEDPEPCRDLTRIERARDAAQAKREEQEGSSGPKADYTAKHGHAAGPVEPAPISTEDSGVVMQRIMDQIKDKLAPIVEKQQVVPTDPALQHLGGYVAGGDDATWYPELWKWLKDNLKIESVLDVGCGDGQAVKYFRDTLYIPRVFGIDGLPQEDPSIEVHDFTKGPWPPGHWPPYDLIWCCEFVEHIDEEFMPNFLETFKLGHYVAMTHAAPGQAGHHHVNCRDEQYWIGVMATIGYKYDNTLTQCARIAASVNTNPWNHFKRSGLCFKRQPTSNTLSK